MKNIFSSLIVSVVAILVIASVPSRSSATEKFRELEKGAAMGIALTCAKAIENACTVNTPRKDLLDIIDTLADEIDEVGNKISKEEVSRALGIVSASAAEFYQEDVCDSSVEAIRDRCFERLLSIIGQKLGPEDENN